MSFSDLKKQSKLGNLTAKLVKEVEKMNTSSGSSDDRVWKLDVDKSGNGYAVIRFLPAPNGEDLPFVKLYSHAFQGPGGWYIENSLTTLGQKDPVSELNSELWNNGTDAGKELARKQKRKLTYVSNIYVVKDPANPANEGKVFLFKYGKKIFDKLTAAMQPEFEDEEAIDPFDFWQGANFKLKAKNVAGYRNYDSSEFAKAGALLDDDDAMEAIWKKQYSLAELVSADQFKSYDELKKRLDYVLGVKGGNNSRRVDEEVAVAKHARRIDRDGDERRFAAGDQRCVVRQRHLGGVELLELQLPPENLGGLHVEVVQVDALDRHRAGVERQRLHLRRRHHRQQPRDGRGNCGSEFARSANRCGLLALAHLHRLFRAIARCVPPEFDDHRCDPERSGGPQAKNLLGRVSDRLPARCRRRGVDQRRLEQGPRVRFRAKGPQSSGVRVSTEPAL